MDTTPTKSSSDQSKTGGQGSSHPKTLSEIVGDFRELSVPAHLRDECQREYVRARQGLPLHSHTGSTSSRPDTASRRQTSSSELIVVPTLAEDDPLVKTVTRMEAESAVLNLSRAMNFEPSREMIEMTAKALIWDAWKLPALTAAAMHIMTSPDLAKEARYAGAPTADVFAQTKSHPRVIAGRLLIWADANDLIRRYSSRAPHSASRLHAEVLRPVLVEGRRGKRFHLYRPQVLEQIMISRQIKQKK